MRRLLSVFLFILGGWVLATESMMASIEMGQGDGVGWTMAGFMFGFAAPFLLLGMWASPGNRFADIGMAVMVSAGTGAVIALMLVVVSHDPGMARVMPPGQKMPQFNFAIFRGLVNLLVIGGGGYLLWRFGRRPAPTVEPDLERIFGDE